MKTKFERQQILFFAIIGCYLLLYVPFGINETDGGFITAYAWRLLHGEQLTGHSDCSLHIPRRRPSLEKGWCSDSRLMYDQPVTQEQRHNAWNKMIEKLTPGVSPSKLSPMTKGHMVPLTPTLSQAATLRRVISPSA